MKNLRRAAAVIVLAAVICGWYFTIFGFGKIGGIKDHMKLGLDLQGGVYVVLEADTDAKGEELAKLMQQTQSVIDKRVNELGLTNPVVSVENENRIRVELPGAQDADSAIESIGKTAQLSFITADANLILDGSNVKDAGSQINQNGAGYVVTLQFDSTGAAAFEEATRKIVNNEITANEQIGMPANTIAIILDNEVISNPSVSTVISGGSCQIEGKFTQEEAAELAALIRGGALPVELKEVQTSVVGPTLGMDSLKSSIIAAAIGFVLVALMMLLVYRVMGLCADIALAAYGLIYLWLLVAFRNVLTLPGIAGMILTIGMAVDANVIIFSRIREEVRKGKTIRVATAQGYRRALTTVIDSQVTTLIAGVALYEFGYGDVRGFALTLMIGTILSIFTATVLTNLYLLLVSENRHLATNTLFGIRMPKEAAAVPEAVDSVPVSEKKTEEEPVPAETEPEIKEESASVEPEPAQEEPTEAAEIPEEETETKEDPAPAEPETAQAEPAEAMEETAAKEEPVPEEPAPEQEDPEKTVETPETEQKEVDA